MEQKGILSLSSLGDILKQLERYPENKRLFLMGLMEKFELCFKFGDHNPARYLISDLLPPDEPDVDIYETAPLHFQYHYDILPSSIISRFIGRNHTMIHRMMLWRSGVVLTQDQCKALVRADGEDNFIAIKVQGNRGSALLATIRADFKKIHNTIPHLAVREYLVIRECKDGKPTGRELPVDYNYLCRLDQNGIVECILPKLEGKYNPRDILEGIESRKRRLDDLPDRLDRSRKSRESRPLKPQKNKPRKTGLIKISGILLGILCVVSAIFVVVANSLLGANPFIVIPAILLAFAVVVIVTLRITGIITEDAFNKGLAGFFKAVPMLKGKEPENPEKDDAKKLPAETNSKR
jgi:internalin A